MVGHRISKCWATGLGAAAAAAWGSLARWWDSQTGQPATQRVALWAVAIVTAAAVLGIAYLLGSDVRGRAAASVATISARAELAQVLCRAASDVFKPDPPHGAKQVVALPSPLPMIYPAKPQRRRARMDSYCRSPRCRRRDGVPVG